MRAMRFEQKGRPRAQETFAAPDPGSAKIRIVVKACAVCRTNLHVVDGAPGDPRHPLVPGHEIIGTVMGCT